MSTSRRTASPDARLAAAGLSPERARARLTEAGMWTDEGPAPGTLELVDALSDTPSPEDALLVLTELASSHPDVCRRVRDQAGWLGRFLAVAGTSRSLGDLLATHPELLGGLSDPGRVDAERVRREAVASARDLPDDEGRAAVFARIRRRVTAEIAAQDLTGVLSLEEVTSDLSRLAEGLLAAVVDILEPDLPDGMRLCVLGMGKLGGGELNYVSDVDVIFVHDPGPCGEEEARAAANGLAARLLRVLSTVTPMGRAYEVDADLRPEGRDGPLSRTVSSFVAYWQRWAKTWEFQAMLKARPVAGDPALGGQLLSEAEPFVFPEQLAPEVVDEIRSMKHRVESKPEVTRSGARQLKLGPGGIRDIEFATQLLQLVHGRADERLRETGTLPALSALAEGGYVAEEDARTFVEAYRFLRRVEHRLQLADERRTHTVPDDPGRLERLARSMGSRPQDNEPAREVFLEDLRRVQGDVRELHAKLFYRPLLELHAAVPAGDAALISERTGLDERAAARRLEALGFRDGRGVLRHVRSMTSGLSRRASTLRTVLPAMLHALSETADPDTGVRVLRDLIETHGEDTALIGSLRDQPPVAELLARILGTSEVAGELLISSPQGVDWLVDPDGRSEPRTRDELVGAAHGLMRWQVELDERGAALRRFKRRELVRVVVRDLAGDARVAEVGSELTAIGEACLEAGLRAVLDDLREGRTGPDPAHVAIIGMGKLGGRELHYVSDLDVVFVHSAARGATEEQATGFATAVAEGVLAVLSAVTAEGTAFEVDPELRPEGRSGPLTRSLSSMETYYERWAETWERQALLKARPVAGDKDLGEAFSELARIHAYPDEPDPSTEMEIRKMKARIERERVSIRTDPARHLKLGPGGLTDIEWTIQLLQRRHGRHEPMLWTTSTMAGLDALQDVGVVNSSDAQVLRHGYRFLSEIRNRLYLQRVRDVDVLPPSDPAVEKLARSLGYGRGGRQEFEDDYRRSTRRVRRVVERLFYGQD